MKWLLFVIVTCSNPSALVQLSDKASLLIKIFQTIKCATGTLHF